MDLQYVVIPLDASVCYTELPVDVLDKGDYCEAAVRKPTYGALVNSCFV